MFVLPDEKHTGVFTIPLSTDDATVSDIITSLEPSSEFLPTSLKPYHTYNVALQEFSEQIAQLELARGCCLVCALPHIKKQELESLLFDEQVPYDDVSVKYGIAVHSLKHHTQHCIISASRFPIPKEDLLILMIQEINDFALLLRNYKTSFKDDPSPEGLASYTIAFEKLLDKAEKLKRIESNKEIGHRINKNIIESTCVRLMQKFVANALNIRTKLFEELPEGEAHTSIKRMFDDLVMTLGYAVDEQMTESKDVLLETLGLRAKDIS